MNSLAYTRNPLSKTVLEPPIVPEAEVRINGVVWGTLIANWDNDPNDDLQNIEWRPASFEFEANSASTQISFRSLNTSGCYGVFVDAVELRPNPN